MLRDEIQQDMIAAMKAQAKERLEALRYLWSLIRNAEIDAKGNLADEQVMKVIQTEVKKRKEAIEQMKQGGRDELASEEEVKLKVLMEFLPEQMREGEISELVNQIISEQQTKDFGTIMREVMKKAAGKADGKMVSEVVKAKISLSL